MDPSRPTLPALRREEQKRERQRLVELRLDPAAVDSIRKSVFAEISLRNDRGRASEKAEKLRLARLAFAEAMFRADDPQTWVDAAREAAGL